MVANLSARVGSIGDNRLGGWYSYRASKAAVNQVGAGARVDAPGGHVAPHSSLRRGADPGLRPLPPSFARLRFPLNVIHACKD